MRVLIVRETCVFACAQRVLRRRARRLPWEKISVAATGYFFLYTFLTFVCRFQPETFFFSNPLKARLRPTTHRCRPCLVMRVYPHSQAALASAAKTYDASRYVDSESETHRGKGRNKIDKVAASEGYRLAGLDRIPGKHAATTEYTQEKTVTPPVKPTPTPAVDTGPVRRRRRRLRDQVSGAQGL